MNFNIIQLFLKWFSIISMSFMSFFGIYDENDISFNNENATKNVNIINYVEKHDTKIVYNSKLPSNISRVVTEGVDKITYKIIGDDSEPKLLQDAVTEVIEKGTGAYGLYYGRLTGYSADCGAGCTGEGYLACKTADKKRFSIKYDGIYYDDDTYGKVRILSASKNFPCGTIIQVTKKGIDPYYAVVMDRGGAMNKAWENNLILMDLAFEDNDLKKINELAGKNIEFSVQRWGW